MTPYYQVGWGSCQFHYVEDRVETSHREGELQSISVLGNLPFYWEQAEPAMRQLPRWVDGTDIRGI